MDGDPAGPWNAWLPRGSEGDDLIMATDHVDIDPQQVADGLRKWDPATEKLENEWRKKFGEITERAGGSPWGGDAAGTKFRGKYEPGAEKFKDDGDEFVKAVQNTGQKVRGIVDESLASDDEQAAKMGTVFDTPLGKFPRLKPISEL